MTLAPNAEPVPRWTMAETRPVPRVAGTRESVSFGQEKNATHTRAPGHENARRERRPRAPRAEERRHEGKEEFNDSSGEGCFRRNADIWQMMSLIINAKDVKGTDKEAKGTERAYPTAGKRTYPTARRVASKRGHRAETWRSEVRCQSRTACFGGAQQNARREVTQRSLARHA